MTASSIRSSLDPWTMVLPLGSAAVFARSSASVVHLHPRSVTAADYDAAVVVELLESGDEIAVLLLPDDDLPEDCERWDIAILAAAVVPVAESEARIGMNWIDWWEQGSDCRTDYSRSPYSRQAHKRVARSDGSMMRARTWTARSRSRGWEPLPESASRTGTEAGGECRWSH